MSERFDTLQLLGQHGLPEQHSEQQPPGAPDAGPSGAAGLGGGLRLDDLDREALLHHVLDLEARLQSVLQAGPCSAWNSLDLTMPQIKTLVALAASAARGEAAVRMSVLGQSLHAGVSTMTGIVDRLVERGLVERGGDPEDRRIVLVQLAPEGRDTISRLYSLGREQLGVLLERVPTDDLLVIAQAMDILQRAATSLLAERVSVTVEALDSPHAPDAAEQPEPTGPHHSSNTPKSAAGAALGLASQEGRAPVVTSPTL